MINFNYETNFSLPDESRLNNWIINVISEEGCILDEINYIFCDDAFLLKLNVEYLNHDTLTDIISFDNSIGKIIQGDIFISVERVADNAKDFNVSLQEELHRVMVHGVLHFCGYKDKSESESLLMRQKENHYIKQLA
ncbi:rRNA maturation RNase YbeY [Mariniflexile maritimum]|uniref:rRNA maturation RNase YbeY n=1 Tax=Mariniflexile maritimum TaxID=2682493 RepID=UPI0012F6CDC5|nr:rRNA maturation RNase YbeY [Mariniflexile maritimum]